MSPVYLVIAKWGSIYNGAEHGEYVIYAGLDRDKAIRYAFDSGNTKSYFCYVQTWVGQEMIIEEEITETIGE